MDFIAGMAVLAIVLYVARHLGYATIEFHKKKEENGDSDGGGRRP